MKEILYKVLDILTVGKGLTKVFSGVKVRIPTRYINYFWSDYEQFNFKFTKEKLRPNDVVLDVGAHIGLFSCIAAKSVGTNGLVYAFEPTPATYALLTKTIEINKLENNIKPFDLAMGLKEGTTTFYISDLTGDNSNSLVNYVDSRGPLRGIDIKVMSIDAFVNKYKLSKVNFIKIDVEGAEYDTLKGAEITLKSLRPYCILAIHPAGIKSKGDSMEIIYDFLVQCNYSILFNDTAISRLTFCNTSDLIDLHLLPL
ncbi:MAG: FkbM family methyltransferase [Chitinophagaceae bacterium]